MTILPEDQMRELQDLATHHRITAQDLLARCDVHFGGSIEDPNKSAAGSLLSTLHALNRTGPLVDGSVPLIGALADFVDQLDLRQSPDVTRVIEVLRVASARIPEASRALHEERGALVALTRKPPSERSSKLPSKPPGRPISSLTIAAAGTLGGVAASVMLALFPRAWGGLTDDVACYTTAAAAPSAGAFMAVAAWSLAEQILRLRRRRGRRRVRQALVLSGAALLSGAAISLLAQFVATFAYTPGPSAEWPAIGAAGASGVLALVWGRRMARPTTLLAAGWTGVVGAGGVLAGYAAFTVLVLFLNWSRWGGPEMLAPIRHAPMVAATTLAFVSVFQSVMAGLLHGASAVQLRAVDLPEKPEHVVVPRWVLGSIVVGASLMAVVLLSHAFLAPLPVARP
jgi:hypothetical protein